MAASVSYKIKATDQTRSGTESAKTNIKDLDSTTQRFAKNMNTALGAIKFAAIVKGVQMVGREMVQLVRAYGEQEKAEQKLSLAAKNNPYLDEGNVRNLTKFATELQKTAGVGDEVTLSYAGMLASMGRTETQITELMTAATNLSAVTDMSLDSAVKNLNKTFGGTVGELGELLPEVKDLDSSTLAAGGAVEYINEQFAGMGEELHNNVNGALDDFNNAWGDFKEVLGQGLAPLFTSTLEWLTDLVSGIGEFIDKMYELKAAREAVESGDATPEQELTVYQAETDRLRRKESELLHARDMVRNKGSSGDGLTAEIRELQDLIRQREQAASYMSASIEHERRAEAQSESGPQEEALTFAQIVNQELLAELDAIAKREAALPDQTNESALQESAVINAIERLLEHGYEAGGDGSIDWFLDEYGHYLEELTETTRPEGGRRGSRGDRTGGGNEGETRDGDRTGRAEEFRKLIEQLNTQIGINEQFAMMQGDTYDLLGENQRDFNKLITDLIKSGEEYNGALIQGLIEYFNENIAPPLEETAESVSSQGSAEFTEGPIGEAIGSSSGGGEADSGGGFLSSLGSVFAGMLGPIGLLVEYLLDLLSKIEAVAQLMAPVTVIIEGMLKVLGPVVNEGLAPLVGMLNLVGQLLGGLLLPIFNMLLPVIELVGQAFVWIYNKILVPVYNQIQTWGNKVYNAFAQFLNWIIGLLNKIPGVNIRGVSTRSLDSGHIDTISTEDLTTESGITEGTSGGGGGASYTAARDITVNITVNTDVITGDDGGIRELARILMREMSEVQALNI